MKNYIYVPETTLKTAGKKTGKGKKKENNTVLVFVCLFLLFLLLFVPSPLIIYFANL